MITEQENDKNFKRSMELIEKWGEQNKPPTLYQIIHNEMGFSHELTVEILVAVDRWLPYEHKTNSYDWNRCIKMLREKLK
jgi:hypothetical protein